MTPAEAALVIAALILGATVKALTGMGLPLFTIPIASLFVPVETAVVITSLPNMVSNAMLIGEHRIGRQEATFLPRMVTWGIGGAALGTWLLSTLDDRFLLILLVVVVTSYLVVSIRNPNFAWGDKTAKRGTPVAGFVGGLFQGAAGISGPIVVSWTHGMRMSKHAFVFSITVMFAITGAVQIVSMTVLQLWTTERFAISVLGALVVAVLTPFVMRRARRLTAAWFDRLILAMLGISAVSLFVQAVTS